MGMAQASCAARSREGFQGLRGEMNILATICLVVVLWRVLAEWWKATDGLEHPNGLAMWNGIVRIVLLAIPLGRFIYLLARN